MTLEKCIAIDKEHESIAVELHEMGPKNRDTELELLAIVIVNVKKKMEKRKERHQRKSQNICF